ncbi:MAG: hypothetical protein HY820_34070 [Acidobacteria bacterium]|nr:hypothetical protein [Acidobacteriota bacterium]
MNKEQATFHITEDALERLAAGHAFSPEEKECFAVHLFSCRYCQQRYADWQGFVRAFRAAICRIDGEEPGRGASRPPRR